MALSNWLSSAKAAFPRSFNPQRAARQERILSHPYSRLQSLAEVALAAELGILIDVNRACVDDWLRLPGISIHQARALVELAGLGVQFLSLEDLAVALDIQVQQLKPFEPLLFFGYYDPESSIAPSRVNANTASLEELAQIPVIEMALAHQIISHRQQYGVYRNLADLGQRLRLKGQILTHLMHYLKF